MKASNKLSNLSAAGLVAVCPVGCHTCVADDNNLAVCTPTGCSKRWVYIANQQCVGQFL